MSGQGTRPGERAAARRASGADEGAARRLLISAPSFTGRDSELAAIELADAQDNLLNRAAGYAVRVNTVQLTIGQPARGSGAG